MKKKLFLFVVLGFPGSGKTYFSQRLAKKFKLAHLNSFRTRLELFPKPTYAPEEYNILFRAINYMTETLLSRKISVIYDANITKIKYRKLLQNIAKHFDAKYVLIRIHTPLEIALERSKERRKIKSSQKKKYHRVIDSSVVHMIKDEIEEPTKEEFTITIKGTEPFEQQLKTIRAKLKRF
jgi:hypothetical protein